MKESSIKQSKKIMILIVSYNAEKTITRLLERMPEDVWKKAEEIIVADDASQDKTAEMALNYKRKHKIKNLSAIRHERNKGYGGNQKWGYNYAIKKDYDIVVMIHGDAQYPPECIMPLVKKLEETNAGFAFGSRMAGHPLKGGMPLYKFLGNIFLTSIENIALGTHLSEFHSGFRVYSVKALKQIPFNLNSDNFHFDSQIIIQLVIAREKISEITIPTRYSGEKSESNVKVIPYGLNILKELLKYLLTKFHIRAYQNYDKRMFNLNKNILS